MTKVHDTDSRFPVRTAMPREAIRPIMPKDTPPHQGGGISKHDTPYLLPASADLRAPSNKQASLQCGLAQTQTCSTSASTSPQRATEQKLLHLPRDEDLLLLSSLETEWKPSAIDSLQPQSIVTRDNQPDSSLVPTKRTTEQCATKNAPLKRRRTGYNGCDNDAKGTRKEANTNTKESGGSKAFACPYFRLNPIRHIECISRRLNRIQDVKQHLNRRHTIPRSCSRCHQSSTLTSSNEERMQSCGCDLQVTLDNRHGVSRSAQGRLKYRLDRTMEAEDQWKTIWEILFQESNPAARPYLDNVVEEVISIIRDFCNNIEGNQIVSGFVQSQNLPTGLTVSAQRLMTGLLDEFRTHFSQALCGSYQAATLETQTDNQQDKSLQRNGKKILSGPMYCSITEDIKQEPFSRSSSLDDYECYWSNNTSEPSYTLAPSPSPDYSPFLPVSLDLLPGQLPFNGTTYPDSGGLPENNKWDIDGPSGMHKACNSQLFNEPSPVYYSSDDMASTELLALQPDQFSDPDNLSFHLPQDEVEF